MAETRNAPEIDDNRSRAAAAGLSLDVHRQRGAQSVYTDPGAGSAGRGESGGAAVTPRGLDGSIAGIATEDPHAAARRLDTETLGWRIWSGNKTRHFFAVPIGRNVMIEAKTTHCLIEAIIAETSATYTPCFLAAEGKRSYQKPCRSPRLVYSGEGRGRECGGSAATFSVVA
jgi:hypothetical protein